MPKATKKTLKELHPAVTNFQTKLAAEAKVILKNECSGLFADFPNVEAIRWTQRIPLENPEFVHTNKSEFTIDNVEYRVKGQRIDEDWYSPWNDSRTENPDFLDSLTEFENQLFDAEETLSLAIGQYDRVTVTRTDVLFDTL